MSLIEQAAKRLEELKRSGVEQPARPRESDEAPPPAATPDTIVRAIEARGGVFPEHASAAPTAPHAAPYPANPGRRLEGEAFAPAAHRSLSTPTPPPKITHRSINIDLARLKSRGFVTPDAPQSQIADEFRVIKRPIIRNARSNAALGARGPNGNLVMVTSALPGEGKTFTSLNLAMSIAMEYDSTVLLVDADVARPGLPGLLGVPESPGLLDLLTDDRLDIADALVKTNIDRLTLLPAGAPRRRSTELLASDQLRALLRELAARYNDRVIIFDSPPLLSTTEARVLPPHMGQVVVVVAAGSTSQNEVNEALSMVSGCEIVLMMLNKANPADVGLYNYYSADAAS